MELIPAIDLRDGRCVRLVQGDFARETRYAVDPVELGARYRDLGARWLHIVDLDGAKRGAPINLALVARIRARAGLSVQFGGGIRDRESLEQALEIADRVVVGSLAVTAPELVGAWLEELGAERVALALDVRVGPHDDAAIATHGWTRPSSATLSSAVEEYLPAGLKHVLCTDIDRDGALGGPNIALYADCVRRWPAVEFQASGGVRHAADLDALAATKVAAAISGRALLDGRISDEEIRRFSPNA
jgi:phosphoribosylformimino-5-aminoimidazole carboxamide ribotide isomerase